MKKVIILITGILFLVFPCLKTQNPLITDQFTADPSARVFDGKVYVYPSHDIPCKPGQGFIGFCMADYHVFSSENLTDWEDHGVILTQDNVPWCDSTSFSLWAPDCIFRNGKYYFYYSAIEKGKIKERGRAVGVAISDKPYGPFIPEEKPISPGIDPNPFIDKDEQAYLYWSDRGKLYIARLSNDMKNITAEPQIIDNMPKGLKEGPFVFERNGIYYLTFAQVQNRIERLAYATGNNPMGPFTVRGVIMDESPTGCWTNHQSIIEYKNQWYLFYHHNDLSPKFDKNRSIKADSLSFNKDGTIRKVTPTLRGVGISDATGKIQIDRYSDCSESGVSLSFIDESKKMKGWKVSLSGENSWIRYNNVSFNDLKQQNIRINGFSKKSGSVTIRIDNQYGPIVAQVEIPETGNWNIIRSKLKEIPAGIHDLFITLNNTEEVEIDWISFE